jgi:hypothetical protein
MHSFSNAVYAATTPTGTALMLANKAEDLSLTHVDQTVNLHSHAL